MSRNSREGVTAVSPPADRGGDTAARRRKNGNRKKLFFTEELSHLGDQVKNPLVFDLVVDEVSVFSGTDNALVAQNGQMLGDIGIGGLNLLTNIADRQFLRLQEAEDLQPDRVRHGLKQSRNIFYVIVFHLQTSAISAFNLIPIHSHVKDFSTAAAL
jgi:hypothetical protein